MKGDLATLGVVKGAVPPVVIDPKETEHAQHQQAVENHIEGEIRERNHAGNVARRRTDAKGKAPMTAGLPSSQDAGTYFSGHQVMIIQSVRQPVCVNLKTKVFVGLAVFLPIALAMAELPAAQSKPNQPDSLADLLALPPEELAKVDLGLMGLLTAEGLRGSENLNVAECMRILDTWTNLVDREIQRNYHRFREHPEEYNHSEGEFRMGMLITILQQDFRTRYSPERAAPLKRGEWEPDDTFYGDSKETFIHGLLTENRSGTCSSMPVLYAAIARRLGWPVTLAATKAHWFMRYEEGDKHLNVESSGEGFNIYPDEHYKNWPFPATDEEIKAYRLLQPLNMKEVLGALLVNRAGNLKSANRLAESVDSWRQAARYLPDTPELRRVVEFAQIQVQASQDQTRWNALWDEVTKLRIPDGPQSPALKNRKARVQFFMVRSTHLATIEGEIKALKNDLAEYEKAMVQARDSALPPGFGPLSPPTPLRPQPPQETGVVRIRNISGKEMLIPAERIPAEYRKGVPADLFAVLATMDDEAAIEMEMWAHYRSSENPGSPRRIRIPQERIPPAYWNGLPGDLLDQLQDIEHADAAVGKIWMYFADDMNRQDRAMRRAFQPQQKPATLCPGCRKFHLRNETHHSSSPAVTIDPMRLPMAYQRTIPPELAERMQDKHDEWAVIEEARKYEQEQSRHRMGSWPTSNQRNPKPGVAAPRRVQIEFIPRTDSANNRPLSMPTMPLTLQPTTPISLSAGQKGNP